VVIRTRRKARKANELFAAAALAAYLVQPGDTLSGIAASHGVSLAAVEAANPQIGNPNLIFAGQNVSFSGGSSAQAYSAPRTYTHQSTSATRSTYRSPSSISSSSHTSTSRSSGSSSGSSGYSSGSLSDIPGVPQSFAACVAYRESTNGTNAAYNGGVYGIITASGVNVNGQSVSAQKAAFAQLYKQYGGHPWAADGCPGT
jgi:LysM domain